jgi:phosphate transport system permease protein
MHARTKLEKVTDVVFAELVRIAAISMGCLVIFIVVIVFVSAMPAIQKYGLSFLIETRWDAVEGREMYGVLPMLCGTLVSSFLALLLAVPLALGSAIFLSEDFVPAGLRSVLVFMVELLAAVPSVVYGLWGIFVLIPCLKPVGHFLYTHFSVLPIFSTPLTGPGMLPAAIVLAIMILPIITTVSRDSLAALPPELRQASLGLGATRWETILFVLVPASFSGIMGGVMLALGRAIGETMAVTMLIGNSNKLKASLLAPASTIASLLANQFAEAKNLQVSALMYSALILFVMILLVTALAQLIVSKIHAK